MFTRGKTQESKKGYKEEAQAYYFDTLEDHQAGELEYLKSILLSLQRNDRGIFSALVMGLEVEYITSPAIPVMQDIFEALYHALELKGSSRKNFFLAVISLVKQISAISIGIREELASSVQPLLTRVIAANESVDLSLPIIRAFPLVLSDPGVVTTIFLRALKIDNFSALENIDKIENIATSSEDVLAAAAYKNAKALEFSLSRLRSREMQYAVNDENKNALHILFSVNPHRKAPDFIRCVEILIGRFSEESIIAQDNMGNTALHYCQHAAAAKLLTGKSFGLIFVENLDGQTPLGCAIANKRTTIITALIEVARAYIQTNPDPEFFDKIYLWAESGYALTLSSDLFRDHKFRVIGALNEILQWRSPKSEPSENPPPRYFLVPIPRDEALNHIVPPLRLSVKRRKTSMPDRETTDLILNLDSVVSSQIKPGNQ